MLVEALISQKVPTKDDTWMSRHSSHKRQDEQGGKIVTVLAWCTILWEHRCDELNTFCRLKVFGNWFSD